MPLLVGDVPLLVGDVSLLVGDVSLLVGDVPLLVGDVTLLVGDVPLLVGDVSLLVGDVTLLMGDVPLLVGDVSSPRLQLKLELSIDDKRLIIIILHTVCAFRCAVMKRRDCSCCKFWDIYAGTQVCTWPSYACGYAEDCEFMCMGMHGSEINSCQVIVILRTLCLFFTWQLKNKRRVRDKLSRVSWLTYHWLMRWQRGWTEVA